MSHRAAPEIAPESSFDTTWYVRYTYAGPSDEDVNNFYRSKQHDPANDLGVNASGAFAARIVETLASAALVDRFGDPIAMSERPGLGRHTIPSGANETFSMLEVEAPYTDTLRHVALPVALPGARWNAAPAIADALSARVLPRTAGELAGVISKLWHREIGTTMRKAPFDRGGVGVDELVQGFAALGNVVVATAARRLKFIEPYPSFRMEVLKVENTNDITAVHAPYMPNVDPALQFRLNSNHTDGVTARTW